MCPPLYRRHDFYPGSITEHGISVSRDRLKSGKGKSDQAIVVLKARESGKERRAWVIQMNIHNNNPKTGMIHDEYTRKENSTY
ncbi:hypothetical protein [Lunatibacter salilacus]|uniref:hypothetical protein n=1 Tax=Lunatibacter salilacus TaxID=2483804 RepID=UPI00131E2D1F|nr:hypothetical protein [Lunatibacter salilacus]